MQKFKDRLARVGGGGGSSSSSSASKSSRDEKPRVRRTQSAAATDPRDKRRDGDLVVLYDGTRGAAATSSTSVSSSSSSSPPPKLPETDRLSIDIVLVPGLNESNATAWTRGDVCWPRDLLSRDFPRSRIMVWGWRGGPSSASGTFSTQAENLILDLNQARAGVDRPVLFQGHGLGGLVVKEALVMAATARIYGHEPEFGAVYPHTMGCVFWGTPHVRSRHRPLGECLALTALLAPSPPPIPLIRSLRDNDEAFEQLHSTWLMVSRDIRVSCVREDLPTVVYVPSDVAAQCNVPGIKKGPNQIMMPKDVAFYSVPNIRTNVVNANHADIVRFSGRDDPLYRNGVIALAKVAMGPTQAEMDAQSPRSQEILDAIYYDSMSEREAGIEPAHSQTCDWLLPSIKDFLNSDDSLLWISGKAGSGKSTLMKHAWKSEALRKELQQGWARDGELLMVRSYFFESGRSIQKSLEGFLRSTMFQILSERRDLIRVAFPTFFDGPWPPTTLFTSITNLNQGWYSLLAHMPNMRLFVLTDGIEEYRIVDRKDLYDPKDRDCTYTVDAGDESWGTNKWIADSHAEVANLLLSMANKETFKHVFTGRELPVFEQAFEGIPRIRMQEHTEEAVAHYIQGRLQVEAPGLPQMQSLCQHLSQKSNGDVLWAKMAIDVLVESPLRTLGAAIDALPQQLGGTDGLYMYLLKKLSAEERRMAHLIFWLALRVRQAPTLITIALAREGYLDSTGHELKIRGDDVTPHTSQSLQKLSEDMVQHLYGTCARLLEAEAPSSTSWNETGQRIVFRHLTAKEWVARRDVWERLGVPMVSDVYLDFCLLSGLVRHIKTFGGAQKPMVLAWPVPRFRPDAWLLISKALRVAERLDSSVSDEELGLYFTLLDELDVIGQRGWISALDKHKPLYEDPEWYAKRLPALHKKHWSSCEPMEVGKPPKRKDFLTLAIQANLLRYVSAKLQRLGPDDRKSRAQGLLSCVVSPQPEGRSACISLSGDFLDFHHDMPDSRLLDVLFAAGAELQGSEKIWLKTLKTGRRFFQRSNMTMSHLLETGASQRLMLNRERWVAAVKALLLRGADPRVEVKISTESTADEASSTTTVAAAEFIRETLEGEPEYAVELLELEKLMGKKGGSHET